jgi:hypothetical protein
LYGGVDEPNQPEFIRSFTQFLNMQPLSSLRPIVCAAAIALSFSAAAEDTYYNVLLGSLQLTEGALPISSRSPGASFDSASVMHSYAVLDGPGEAYLHEPNRFPWLSEDRDQPDDPPRILIRAPQGADITGRLFVPQTNFNSMLALKFKIPASAATPDAKKVFYIEKSRYYRSLQEQNIPGSAWFRHQAQDASRLAGVTNIEPPPFMGATRRRPPEVEDAYDLFTGGRALSENLQLDRVLPGTKPADQTVPLTNITGITVREMNWKELLKDAKPELDPLANYIPADQHVIFFPSFQAMMQMIDEADTNGTPVLQLLEPRAEDVNSRARYQKQLCLGLTEISRVIGPQLISSAAFTGSDPFLRVGTDLAVLFETRDPAMLTTLLQTQQKSIQKLNPEAQSVKGSIADVAYSGVVSADRSVCSYIATFSNVVYVSNSKVQLENLLRVAKGSEPRLSSQDDYRFFRNQYPRAKGGETAFVVLTDATIRRWCGPRWRIADARRTFVAGAMTELQAAHLDEITAGSARDPVVTSSLDTPAGREFRLSRSGITSPAYGSLNFMTPIAELPITNVTPAEKASYERWRDSYQRNWRQFFDPIAIRFSLAADRVSTELTVTPLIASSDYADLIRLVSGTEIAAGAGDPHTNALFHFLFAINTESKPVQEASNFAISMAPGLKANPLAWLGQSIAVYADDDPFWIQLTDATNAENFLEHNYNKLPVALHFEVKNPLKLAAFLTAAHAFVDQSAPGMTAWQNQEYNGQPYVKVESKTSNGSNDEPEPTIYYAAAPRSLIVTMNESLLKRALDRQAALVAASNAPAVMPWPGKSIAVAAQRRFFDALQLLARDSYQKQLQTLAWSNLPILNEWKRMFPDKDPVALHEQVWGTKLLCPGGGSYVWNSKWATMESTVFGHPGEPKTNTPRTLADIQSAEMGVTFENGGLSAKATLIRGATK